MAGAAANRPPGGHVAAMAAHAAELAAGGRRVAVVVRDRFEAAAIATALAAELAGITADDLEVPIRVGKPDWRRPPAPWRPGCADRQRGGDAGPRVHAVPDPESLAGLGEGTLGRVLDVLGSRVAPLPRARDRAWLLDGQPAGLRDLVRAANAWLAGAGYPAIAYPGL